MIFDLKFGRDIELEVGKETQQTVCDLEFVRGRYEVNCTACC